MLFIETQCTLVSVATEVLLCCLYFMGKLQRQLLVILWINLLQESCWLLDIFCFPFGGMEFCVCMRDTCTQKAHTMN